MRKRVQNGYLGCFSELTEGKRTEKSLLQMLIEEYFPFGGSDSKEFVCNAAAPGSIPGSGRPMEEGMATHCSIPAWRIPWTEEPGGLYSS